MFYLQPPLTAIGMRALDQYKSWPGLQNPRAEEPISIARAEWEARKQKARLYRIRSMLYRWMRTIRRGGALLYQELTEAPKRTIVEVALGLPLVLMAIDPVRSKATQWAYAWHAFAALILVNFLFGVMRRLYERREALRRIIKSAEFLQLVIECTRPHLKEGADGLQPTQEHLRHTIAIILQAMVDLTRQVLLVPDNISIHANLMIPMPVLVTGQSELQHGCGIVAYSLKRPPEPAWTRLVIEDFGAGEAFSRGQVRVIEDTLDPIWLGIFTEVRSRCFASFPVLQGSGKVVAIVNIDADQPSVLTRKNSGTDLYQALTGPLSLLADVLYNTRRK